MITFLTLRPVLEAPPSSFNLTFYSFPDEASSTMTIKHQSIGHLKGPRKEILALIEKAAKDTGIFFAGIQPTIFTCYRHPETKAYCPVTLYEDDDGLPQVSEIGGLFPTVKSAYKIIGQVYRKTPGLKYILVPSEQAAPFQKFIERIKSCSSLKEKLC